MSTSTPDEFTYLMTLPAFEGPQRRRQEPDRQHAVHARGARLPHCPRDAAQPDIFSAAAEGHDALIATGIARAGARR